MKEKFIAILQTFILLVIAYFIYQYYTRPEMVVDVDTFKDSAKKYGYQVTKLKTKDDPRVVEGVYLATDKKGIDIYYRLFRSESDAHNYYVKFNEKVQTKYSLKISRDLRYKKAVAEKQSYSNQYRFFASLYAKNAVIYSETLQSNSKDVQRFIDELFVPPKFKVGDYEF